MGGSGAHYLLRVSVQKSEVDLAAQFLAKGGTLGGAAARGNTSFALSHADKHETFLLTETSQTDRPAAVGQAARAPRARSTLRRCPRAARQRRGRPARAAERPHAPQRGLAAHGRGHQRHARVDARGHGERAAARASSAPSMPARSPRAPRARRRGPTWPSRRSRSGTPTGSRSTRRWACARRRSSAWPPTAARDRGVGALLHARAEGRARRAGAAADQVHLRRGVADDRERQVSRPSPTCTRASWPSATRASTRRATRSPRSVNDTPPALSPRWPRRCSPPRFAQELPGQHCAHARGAARAVAPGDDAVRQGHRHGASRRWRRTRCRTASTARPPTRPRASRCSRPSRGRARAAWTLAGSRTTATARPTWPTSSSSRPRASKRAASTWRLPQPARGGQLDRRALRLGHGGDRGERGARRRGRPHEDDHRRPRDHDAAAQDHALRWRCSAAPGPRSTARSWSTRSSRGR